MSQIGTKFEIGTSNNIDYDTPLEKNNTRVFTHPFAVPISIGVQMDLASLKTKVTSFWNFDQLFFSSHRAKNAHLKNVERQNGI